MFRTFSARARGPLAATALLAATLLVTAPAGAQILSEIGTKDFRISFVGMDADTTRGVQSSDIAYNPDRNEYLVVWSADDDDGGFNLADQEFEIFGRFLKADGTPLDGMAGDTFRISTMAGTRA